jgi:hypothetical protein
MNNLKIRKHKPFENHKKVEVSLHEANLSFKSNKQKKADRLQPSKKVTKFHLRCNARRRDNQFKFLFYVTKTHAEITTTNKSKENEENELKKI